MLWDVDEGYVSASGAGDSRFSLSLARTPASALRAQVDVLVSGEHVLSHVFEIGPRDEQR
jgi:hypothetical protein